MQSSLKTTPKEMSRVEDGPEKEKEKKKRKSHTQNREGTLYRAEQTQTRTG